MSETIVKDSLVQEGATSVLKEPEDIETKNVSEYVYVLYENFEGRHNFYHLRNSKAFDFWKNPEEDIY